MNHDLGDCTLTQIHTLADGAKTAVVLTCVNKNNDGHGRCRKCGLGVGLALARYADRDVMVMTLYSPDDPTMKPQIIAIMADDKLASEATIIRETLSPDPKGNGATIHPFPGPTIVV